MLFVASWRLDRVESGPPVVATPAGASKLFVQFRLQAQAADVRLAGSFTNWEPTYRLHQIAPGMWTITVPLSQGVHDYAFVVDGQQWIADPYAPQIRDGFGGANNRMTVLLPDTPRT
jgi:1,4-alpha-glucan branching enzyme